MPEEKLNRWGNAAKQIGAMAVVVIPLLLAVWFVLKEPIREALGVTSLETQVRLQTEDEHARGKRIDFVAVVVICRSGDYTVEEIKKIKTDYRRGRLDVDSLVADWYEQ
jgi:hypothetical protein